MKEMADMRQALTEEVAAKHDQVVVLRKEIQIFEDRCIQADKQTAFKEDIIRELRKEIKQLKQQVSVPEKLLLHSPANSVARHTQLTHSEINKQPPPKENPYIIVNHSSKKQDGKNTVIYISKDGNVHKEVNYKETSKNLVEIQSRDHMDICSKCKDKLKNTKSFFPSCKSETDLVSVKNMLKPIKPRSKLTNSILSRCKTFVDQTKRTINEIECEGLSCRGKSTESYVPVKMHVDYLEKTLVSEI